MITQQQADSFLNIAHANIQTKNTGMPQALLKSLSALLMIEKDKSNKNESFICETTRVFSLFICSEFVPAQNDLYSHLTKLDQTIPIIESQKRSEPKLIQSMDEMLDELKEYSKYIRVIDEVETAIDETCKPIMNAKAIYEYFFQKQQYNYRKIKLPAINTSTISQLDESEIEPKITFTEKDKPKFINIYTRFLMSKYYGEKGHFDENLIRIVNAVVIAFSTLYTEVLLLQKYQQHLTKLYD